MVPESARIVNAEACRLPFTSHSVGRILWDYPPAQVRLPDILDQIASEFARVLRPGGQLELLVHDPPSSLGLDPLPTVKGTAEIVRLAMGAPTATSQWQFGPWWRTEGEHDLLNLTKLRFTQAIEASAPDGFDQVNQLQVVIHYIAMRESGPFVSLQLDSYADH